MNVRPITLRDAQAFVHRVHRHHAPPRGARCALGLFAMGDLVGVATMGRPVAREIPGHTIAEVTRVAVADDTKHGCSMLYGAAARVAQASRARTCSTNRSGGRWENEWQRLIVWAQSAPIKPMWAIVPDVPGDAPATFERWERFVGQVPFPRALAVQNGMTVENVKALRTPPEVIAVGGTTEWKWETVSEWAQAFPRVHLLRCNAPTKLYELEALGVESCDGTGWSRGDRKQTQGLEEWARSKAKPVSFPLWPHVCREPKDPNQGSFA